MINKIEINKIVHILILLLLTFFIGVYLVSENLVEYSATSSEISNFHLIIQGLAFISSILFSIYISYDINRKFFIKLAISFVIYWMISYFLLVTQNLNNKSFKLENLSRNHFFEVNSWVLLLLLTVTVLVIRYILSKSVWMETVENWFNDYRGMNVSLPFLMSLVVLQDSKLLDNLGQFLSLDRNGNLTTYIGNLSYKLLFIIIGSILVTDSFWRAVVGIKRNKATVFLSFISSAFVALVLNYALQFGIKANEDFFDKYIFPGATLYQIFMLGLFCFAIYLVVNQYWLSTAIILFLGVTLTLVNSVKFSMRSEPLLLTDFSMMTQLDQIFGFLNGDIDVSYIILYILWIIWIVLFFVYLNSRFLKGKIIVSLKKQLLSISVVVISFLSVITVFLNQEAGHIKENIPVLSRLNNQRDIMFTGYATTARFQSLMFLWTKQATTPTMERPQNYSKNSIESLVKKYQMRAEEINQTRSGNISDKTVIYVLSESLSDPTRIEGVTLTENVLSQIDQIKSETTSGLMKSDAYGGGTANIEIQTLLGLPLYNLSSSIGIYNVQVVPRMSIIPSISDLYLPENRFFIHLGEMKLYSRADVYGRLNFGKLIAEDKQAIKPSVNEKYGVFPSDESTYQNVLENIDTKQNQFFSVVTYQNHVPWDMPEPIELGGQGVGFTDSENGTLSHYVRLLKHTDIVTKEFLDKLSSIDKDITVVFYGDHLPGLYPKFVFENNPESQYLTDYFIWSNRNGVKKDYPKLNSSDFPAAVLAHTNSKVSPYYALLTDILDNASVDKKELTSNQKNIADDLKLIQYDLISGKSYLKEYPEFFKVK